MVNVDGVVADLAELRTRLAVDADENARALAGEALDRIRASLEQLRETEAELLGRAHELETAQARLQAVIESLPVATIVVDADGKAVLQNARARQLLRELDWRDAILLDERGRRLEHHERPLTRALEYGAVTLDRRLLIDVGGERMVIEASATPIFTESGRREGALATWENVSARDRRERAEREFIANAAHELRTPLAAITAAVEVLQAGAKDLPDDRDLFIGHIERECVRLARLGRALLTLARAQAHQQAPRLELVRLRPLLDELVDMLRPPERTQIRIECEDDAATLSNVDLLHQALWNLASNAVRYGGSGEILLAAAAAADGVMTIEVRDSGPGIPEEVRERLLERFVRVGRDGEGFGLGLGIAAQALEAVGGRLELQPSSERGTVARVILPAARLLSEVPA